MMKSFVMFILLLVPVLESNAQEQNFYYSQTCSVYIDGEVLSDWHSEQNAIVFYPYGSSEIIWWIQSAGDTITFTSPKKTTGYDESGYYYEEYEVTTWNFEFGDEETVFIRRYTEDGLLILFFWDGEEMFYP